MFRSPHERISPPHPVAEIQHLKRRVDWLEKHSRSPVIPFVESSFTGANTAQTSGELDFWNKCSINYDLGDSVFILPTGAPPGSRYTLNAPGFYIYALALQYNNVFLGYARTLTMNVYTADIWSPSQAALPSTDTTTASLNLFNLIHVDPSAVPAQLAPQCAAGTNTVNTGRLFVAFLGDVFGWTTLVNG